MRITKVFVVAMGIGLTAAGALNSTVSGRGLASERSIAKKLEIAYVSPLSFGSELNSVLIEAVNDLGDEYGHDFRDLVKMRSIPPATSRQEFCTKIKDPTYLKSLMYDRANRISINNVSGGLGTGLCWWHSEFQRSATYLTVFRSELPKPTREEGKRLIDDILTKQGVVEIPGYRNLYEFTRDYEREIVSALTAAEVTTSLFELGFYKGLIGDATGAGSGIERQMDELYEDVEGKNGIVFQVLQMRGVEAHAWLVINMKKTPMGYDLTFIDSNFLSVGLYRYRRGESMAMYLGSFTPHAYKTSDLGYLKRLQDRYCATGVTSADKRAQQGLYGG